MSDIMLRGEVLRHAVRFANKAGDSMVLPEHLLLAVLNDKEVEKFLLRCDVHKKDVLSDINQFLADEGRVPSSGLGQNHVTLSRDVEIIRNVSGDLAIANGKKATEADAIDVLMAIVAQQDTPSARFLKYRGATPEKTSSEYRLMGRTWEVYNGEALPSDPEWIKRAQHDPDMAPGTYPVPAKRRNNIIRENVKMLNEFGTNLNQRDIDGKIDEVIGRKAEVERALQILGRRSKNNPVFIGDPGVGKTALAESLAKRINRGEVPDSMKNKNIWSIALNDLVAGTKYRGQFEERLKELVREASHPDVILFIDEIDTLMGAGSAEGSVDASAILKPALARGDIRVIGATDKKGWKRIHDEGGALRRRLQKIDLDETDYTSTLRIVHRRKQDYEKHFDLKIPNSSVKAAVDLARHFVINEKSPDRELDIIDETGARLSQMKPPKKAMEIPDVEQTVANRTGMNVNNVRANAGDVVAALDKALKSEVFNQDDAINGIVAAYARARAGLKKQDQPIASFLFLGKTGTGKTESAKVLAKTLGVPLHRIDMSEYMEKFNVSRLTGSPPGYVGYEEGGQLTNAVREKPNAVVLFDEIEKAHPDVFNILLQILDDGRLTDSQGNVVKFGNTIIIMSSNIQQIKSGKVGFDDDAEPRTSGGKLNAHSPELARHFRPELLNRMTAIAQFNDLGLKDQYNIARKIMKEINELARSKKIRIDLTDSAIDYVARNGFDAVYGARPMKRFIDQEIAQAVSEKINRGELKKGWAVLVDCRKDNEGKEILSFVFNGRLNRKKPVNDSAPEATPGASPSAASPLPS
ncbi:MAG: ATP-dependent Clp protease ATP-binding subunit [Proteobacteria bacterium]|nr:ATP-dependent Clp protease ATP-binding subunit [Pseudomonadota bacterium]